MTGYDFERAWLAKFSNCLDEIAGEEIRQAVMQGSQELSAESNRDEVIRWSRDAMQRLEALVENAGKRRAIMTGCACRYPLAELQAVKRTYQASGDIGLVHRMLQEQFVGFLAQSLELDEEVVAEIVARGWGLAGVRQGDTIIATKIPKSGYLVEYMAEPDSDKRRQLYCHCPRVRDALKIGETISATYCYCGAGYYKGIWEEILDIPVEVEMLESVLKGDEVCKVAIYLPLK